MIESITITELATYTNPVTLSDLSAINFFYGANGAGKSTIGRVINNPTEYEKSKVSWKNGKQLKQLVYNQEFIERNFTTVSKLKGVYTFGETKQNELSLIEEKKELLKSAELKLEALLRTLQGDENQKSKQSQLMEIDERFTNECWLKKKKHDERFSKAFEGFRGSATKFREKVMYEFANNRDDILPEAKITKLTESIFIEKPLLIENLPAQPNELITSLENSLIFKKTIIGKNDIDFATLIKKINNSDWVRHGISYLKKTDGICPFCQQATPPNLERKLSEYFDETFEQDTKELALKAEKYNIAAEHYLGYVSFIIETNHKFLNIEILKLKKELIAARLKENIDKINQKINEPSLILNLESSEEYVGSIYVEIAEANAKTNEHNKIIRNHGAEEKKLKSHIWRFIVDELKIEIAKYRQQRQAVEKTIQNLEGKINVGQVATQKIKQEIKDIEKNSTSIEPTVEGINNILRAFGFNGFRLKTIDNNSFYQIVRPDGSNAKATLSEGEKTFITFLYFFHLLKGSEESSGLSVEKIVVIDDPVSSLDNDVLFIISTLIKELLQGLTDNKSDIKQLFLLTHNVYFFKEVTYLHGKHTGRTQRSFWIVRKANEISSVERFATNPIKTSYDLLWSELKRKEKNCSIIQNTMRRILENYFKILGGRNIEDLVRHFEGKEKSLCSSLISWTHDGSHCISDDLYVMTSESIVDRYQRVFFKIFKAENHLAHYELMMGDDYVDLDSNDDEATNNARADGIQ